MELNKAVKQSTPKTEVKAPEPKPQSNAANERTSYPTERAMLKARKAELSNKELITQLTALSKAEEKLIAIYMQDINFQRKVLALILE